MGQGQWSLDCLKEIRKQLNTPEDNWIPKTNSSQMPSSYPVIDRKLLVQKSAPSWHPHAMATGFNAPGFVSKNHGGRGTAEAERDRERINATKTYSKRSTQLQKTVQCKHFIITQWFFLHPAASGRIFDRSWAQKKGPVIWQDAPPVGKWNASNYPVLVWGIQI